MARPIPSFRARQFPPVVEAFQSLRQYDSGIGRNTVPVPCDGDVRMSGPRPLHLSRRGAVYVVRFQIPQGLQVRLGSREIRRSLFTKDIDVARERCLDATHWFRELMRQCTAMPDYTKADVERSVRDYFSSWSRLVETAARSDLEERGVANWTKRNIVAADVGIAACDDELRTGHYSESVMGAAEGLIREAPAYEELSKQLLCRAMRQALRYWKHRMETPALPYNPDDPFFDFEGSPVCTEVSKRSDTASFRHQHHPLPFSLEPSEGPTYPMLSQLVERYV